MTFLYLGIISKRTRIQKYFLILEHREVGKVTSFVRSFCSFSYPCFWTGWRFQGLRKSTGHLESSLTSASPSPLLPPPHCGRRGRAEGMGDAVQPPTWAWAAFWWFSDSLGSCAPVGWEPQCSNGCQGCEDRVMSCSPSVPPEGSRTDTLPLAPKSGCGCNLGQRECAGSVHLAPRGWGVTEEKRQVRPPSWRHCSCWSMQKGTQRRQITLEEAMWRHSINLEPGISTGGKEWANLEGLNFRTALPEKTQKLTEVT